MSIIEALETLGASYADGLDRAAVAKLQWDIYKEERDEFNDLITTDVANKAVYDGHLAQIAALVEERNSLVAERAILAANNPGGINNAAIAAIDQRLLAIDEEQDAEEVAAAAALVTYTASNNACRTKRARVLEVMNAAGATSDEVRDLANDVMTNAQALIDEVRAFFSTTE